MDVGAGARCRLAWPKKQMGEGTLSIAPIINVDLMLSLALSQCRVRSFSRLVRTAVDRRGRRRESKRGLERFDLRRKEPSALSLDNAVDFMELCSSMY